ncbi:MAG TPA: AMP-binding protein, partial [Solirubrobacteraceae bacterium]
MRRRARERPDAEAVVAPEEGARLTYAELDARTDGVARGLLEAGVARGDRVALYSPNGVDWVVVQCAAARVGAVLVALNPAYRAAELRYALAHSGSRLLFAPPRFSASDYVEIVGSIRDDAPALERAIFFGTPEWEGFAVDGPPVDEAVDADDLLSMQYTSGTTGTPKAATLTHHNVVNNARISVARVGAGDDERIAVPVPLFHIFGTTYGTVATFSLGATMVLPGAGFDPGGVLRAVAEERCTVLYGVPAMWIAMLDHPLRAEL